MTFHAFSLHPLKLGKEKIFWLRIMSNISGGFLGGSVVKIHLPVQEI